MVNVKQEKDCRVQRKTSFTRKLFGGKKNKTNNPPPPPPPRNDDLYTNSNANMTAVFSIMRGAFLFTGRCALPRQL